MTGKIRLGFRIPNECQTLPYSAHPRLHLVPWGISHSSCPHSIHILWKEPLAILGFRVILPAVNLVIHKRVDSNERSKAPGLGLEIACALGCVQQLVPADFHPMPGQRLCYIEADNQQNQRIQMTKNYILILWPKSMLIISTQTKCIFNSTSPLQVTKNILGQCSAT